MYIVHWTNASMHWRGNEHEHLFPDSELNIEFQALGLSKFYVVVNTS